MIKDAIFVPNKIINLNFIIMKTKETTQTLQDRKAQLIKELSGKVEGISKDVLELMSTQDLQSMQDKLTIINTVKEPVKAGRGNIAKNVVQWFIDNNITQASREDVRNVIRIENIENFFKVENNMPLPTTRQAVNTYKLLGYLKSSSNKVTDISKRESDWLRRGEAYLRSHVVDETYLKNDETIGYYLIENSSGEIITLVNKEDEAKDKK